MRQQAPLQTPAALRNAPAVTPAVASAAVPSTPAARPAPTITPTPIVAPASPPRAQVPVAPRNGPAVTPAVASVAVPSTPAPRSPRAPAAALRQQQAPRPNGIRIEPAQPQQAAPTPAPAPVPPPPNLKSTSKDWTQLKALMNEKWSEADAFVKSNVLPTKELHDKAEGILNSEILPMVRRGNREYDPINPEKGGIYIRDTVIPKILVFLDFYRKESKTAPRKVQLNGQDVEIYWTDIPGYEKMKPEQRAQAEQEAAQHVVDGTALYNAIINPPDGLLPKPTLKAAGDLVWALKTKAQKANGPYIKGAMTVPNGDKLREYLDRLGGQKGEVYPRSSSHLTEQQKLPGQQARGMDFYDPKGGKDGTLPAGMNTLLYQQVTLPSRNKALYMKMETAAAFGTAKYNCFNGVWGGDPTMPVSRDKRNDDDQHANEHADNYLSGKKEMDRELGAKREDTPKEVKEAWQTYLKTVKDKTMKARLQAASSGTFRLNNVMMALRKLCDETEFDPDDDKDVQAFFKVVEKFGRFESKDDSDSRFGGEAVLTAKDLG
jgi:hypothetical protein